MFLKKIFTGGSKRTDTAVSDFSLLAADMHSHFIPGIDDGAQTLDDSLMLIRHMYRLGFSKLITTPHIQEENFKNTPEIIFQGLERLREALAKEQIPVTLEAAAEYLIDDGFDKLMNEGKLLSFSGKHILIELNYYNPHPDLKNVIFNLQVDGYKVILAHPERYSYWFNDLGKYEDLKDRGVYFQLNTVSLAGLYPDPIKKIAEKLIEKNMIEFLGSDMHNMRYMDAMERSLREKTLIRLLASRRLLNSAL